jgi:hypothetical protein
MCTAWNHVPRSAHGLDAKHPTLVAAADHKRFEVPCIELDDIRGWRMPFNRTQETFLAAEWDTGIALANHEHAVRSDPRKVLGRLETLRKVRAVHFA